MEENTDESSQSIKDDGRPLKKPHAVGEDDGLPLKKKPHAVGEDDGLPLKKPHAVGEDDGLPLKKPHAVGEDDGLPLKKPHAVGEDDGRPQGATPPHRPSPVPTMYEHDDHRCIVGTGAVRRGVGPLAGVRPLL